MDVYGGLEILTNGVYEPTNIPERGAPSCGNIRELQYESMNTITWLRRLGMINFNELVH